MKKIRNKFLFTAVFCGCLLYSTMSQAFLLSFLKGVPPVPVFDPGSLATQLPNNVTATLNQVATLNSKLKKIKLSNLKSQLSKYLDKLDKSEVKIPGTKELTESSVADIYDEVSIREAYKKLFFTYPSDDIHIQNCYKKEGVEFFNDTVIEAFTAVRELEKEVIAYDDKIIEWQKEYTEADDYNIGLYNNFKTSQALDELMIIVQELIAIKTQLQAASAVQGVVEPLYFDTAAGGGA